MTRSKPLVDVVIPVLNEELDLEPSVRRLHEHVQHLNDYTWRIIVADNGSTDKTPDIAKRLASELPEVRYIRISERGRGRALRQVWGASDADIVSYMDVDLSTDLAALKDLVGCLMSGYDLSTGCRLHPDADIRRSTLREILSRGYNVLLRLSLGIRFRDAQCGFKAATSSFIREAVHHTKSTKWFFDTELLVIAEKNGYRIKEVPVRWIEDPRSTVNIGKAVWEDICGIVRLRFSRLRFRD